MNKVFLSYRHEGVEHARQVRSLAERLRHAGFDVVFDQFANEEVFACGGPPEGWPKWSVDQARTGRVVIVGSAGWFRCFLGHESGGGLGCAAEGGLLRQRLYDSAGRNEEIRIALLTPTPDADIPDELRRYHRFLLPGAQGALETWIRGGAPAPSPQEDGEWPVSAPALDWPLADHHEVRDAVAQLLTRGSAARFLPIEGPSGTGKTTLGKQLLGDALSLDWLAAGRLDFKGSTDLLSEADTMAHHLDVQARGASLVERLGSILAGVTARRRPTLLLFDTYEAAGDASRWIEDNLLFSLIRAPWLRVVIAGQRSAPRSGAWASVTAPLVSVHAPAAEHWYEYGRRHRESLTLDLVQNVHRLANGDPRLLVSLLGPAR